MSHYLLLDYWLSPFGLKECSYGKYLATIKVVEMPDVMRIM
jgi:hypothetical protein